MTIIKVTETRHNGRVSKWEYIGTRLDALRFALKSAQDVTLEAILPWDITTPNDLLEQFTGLNFSDISSCDPQDVKAELEEEHGVGWIFEINERSGGWNVAVVRAPWLGLEKYTPVENLDPRKYCEKEALEAWLKSDLQNLTIEEVQD